MSFCEDFCGGGVLIFYAVNAKFSKISINFLCDLLSLVGGVVGKANLKIDIDDFAVFFIESKDDFSHKTSKKFKCKFWKYAYKAF